MSTYNKNYVLECEWPSTQKIYQRDNLCSTEINQHQVYSKLKPVIEAVKGSWYTGVFTKVPTCLPRQPTHSPFLETSALTPDNSSIYINYIN